MMKIFCDKQNLQAAIAIAQRCASAKSTIPVLGGILLSAVPQGLLLKATDLELAVECLIPAQVEQEGAVVASARYLSDLVRRLPDQQLAIEFDEESRNLVFRYGKSSFNLNTMSAEDFPQLPVVDEGKTLNIPQDAFREMVKQVGAAASNDPLRPLFTGLLWEFRPDELNMVATDTHRLTKKQYPLTETDALEQQPVVVPLRALNELSRLLRDEEKPFRIVFNPGLIAFMGEDFTLTTRPIEGKFPDYDKVIPQSFKCRITIGRQSFLDSLERASLLVSTKDGTSIVNLKIEDGSLVLSSQAVSLGAVREELPVVQQGEPIDIFFNARYILDALRVMDADQVYIDFSGTLSPCVMRPVSEDNFLYLLLPIKY